MSNNQSRPVLRRYLDEEPVAFLVAAGLVIGSIYVQIAHNPALLLIGAIIVASLFALTFLRHGRQSFGSSVIAAVAAFLVHLVDSNRR